LGFPSGVFVAVARERRDDAFCSIWEWADVGTKKTGKGRRKIGRKKRKMRARIRHRK
jgi:hypothetical protein